MNTKDKVLIHKGMDLVRRMQYAEALEVFDRLVSQSPEITEAWNNRGVALFRLGRSGEALESYDRALSLDAKNLEALRNKGFVLRSMGRLEEALDCYFKVMKTGGNALDLEAMAAALVGLGKLEEAMECMLQAIEIQPIDRFEEELGALKEMMMQRSEESPEGIKKRMDGKE